MWGALIGAGASLLGGLFGGKSKKQETTTTSHVDYKRMVREAEAAGFNPLTALRNGGAAGFSVSTGTIPATPLSARIADGVSGAAQTFLANFDPFKDQQRETEFKLVEAQLANLNADTALKQRTGLGSVPTYTGGNTKRTMGAGVGHNQKFKSVADVLPPSAGAPQTPDIEKPKATNPYGVKSGKLIDPNRPDASAWEDRYGDNELMNLYAGLSNKWNDEWYNLVQKNKGKLRDFAGVDRTKRNTGLFGTNWNPFPQIYQEYLSPKNAPLLSPRKKKQ